MQTGRLAETLYEALVPVWPGVSVEVLPSVDSTNSQLLQRGRSGDTAPAAMLALQQSAGRGRMGRTWYGAPGHALMMSLACTLSPKDWAGLSLAVGVAAAGALHSDITLKWPNDLWIGRGSEGRKLGGILIETAAWPSHAGAERWCVVGVGINVAAMVGSEQPLRTPAASLSELRPGFDWAAAAVAVAPAVARAMSQFAAQGFAPFAAAFAQRDALLGHPLRLSDGVSGVARGVAADGALMVQTDQGMRRVSSDEVSVWARGE